MSRRIATTAPVVMLVLLLAEAELVLGPLHSRPLRAVAALPLALYLPGALLRRALMPRLGDDLVDQVVTSLGLSLAALALGGLALNQFGEGLRPKTWLAYLAVVWIASVSLRQLRREPAAADRVLRLPPAGILAGVVVIAALLGGGFVIAVRGAHRQRTVPFAQFWLVPQTDHTYQLGVASYTGRTDAYSVILAVRGQEVRTWKIRLSSSHTWTLALRLPANVAADATLLRQGSPKPYRQVFIRSTSGSI
jgi:hypothetical protein